MLDLQRTPAIRLHQPPQGYLAPGADPVAQAQAVAELTAMVGEFEKPRYFNYKASICAHSRSQKAGCNRCIDVCSTEAISADGDHVKVEPHLCMGCGACATECPSGAMTYAYPSAPDLARRLRTLLPTYERAGGRDAVVLLHAADGRDVIAQRGQARRRPAGAGDPGRGPPHRVGRPRPVAGGARLGRERRSPCWPPAPRRRSTTRRSSHQMRVADAIAQGLGYQGEHFRLLDGADAVAFAAALRDGPPALAVRVPATFAGTPEKRTTAALAIEHLAAHAPVPRKEIALPAGAPFGTIAVDADTCTMCLACVGSCPVGALQDGQEVLELRFVESKCVQCGLCRETCPEHAITLAPRLDLAAEARAPRVVQRRGDLQLHSLRQADGDRQDDRQHAGQAAGHSMFAQPGALDRLKMCADCRVVDLIRNESGPGSGDAGGGAMSEAAITLHHRVEPEDQARADFYALLVAAVRGGARRRAARGHRRGAAARGGRDRRRRRRRRRAAGRGVGPAARRERGDGPGSRDAGVRRRLRRRREERGQPARLALAQPAR